MSELLPRGGLAARCCGRSLSWTRPGGRRGRRPIFCLGQGGWGRSQCPGARGHCPREAAGTRGGQPGSAWPGPETQGCAHLGGCGQPGGTGASEHGPVFAPGSGAVSTSQGPLRDGSPHRAVSPGQQPRARLAPCLGCRQQAAWAEAVLSESPGSSRERGWLPEPGRGPEACLQAALSPRVLSTSVLLHFPLRVGAAPVPPA